MHDAHDAMICIADGAYVDQQEPRRRLTPEHCLQGRRTRWRRSSPTCPRRWRTRSRSPGAAPSARGSASRSCRNSPRTRSRSCAPQARAGLEARLAVIPHAAPVEDYAARLEFELGVIEGMGFPGYFLIVADFIKWAKERGIPVGPGRGSGAGQPRRLRADHHRPRPAALRPALRAVPEPRAHLDAGLRHRLLHGPPRGGDRLRRRAATAATGWRRSSPSARCSPRRRCATSAGCCRCPTARSTGWRS